MKRFLITGGSGLLATNCAISLRDRAEVVLLNHRHCARIPGTCSEQNDYSLKSLQQVVQKVSPDVVINAAGYTNVDDCELNPRLAFEVNAELAARVAIATGEARAKLVHISTDHLFSGDRLIYGEADEPEPMNAYAQSKLEGERKVLCVNPDALIARTNFYGWGVLKKSITDWVIGSLRNRESISAFTDVLFTPISIEQLVFVIEKAIDRNLTGIFNLVGDDKVSKYEFALKVAQVFSLDKELIMPVKSAQKKMLAPRPLNMSLSNKQLLDNLGGDSIELDSGLLRLKQQEESGWPQILRQSVK